MMSKNTKFFVMKDIAKLAPVFVLSLFSLGTLIKSPCQRIDRTIYLESGKVRVSGKGKSEETKVERVEKKGNLTEKESQEFSVRVRGMVMDRTTGTPVVVLETEEQNRFVPIWIGFAEAIAIDMVLRGISPPRPMTHDLIRNILDNIGGKVKKITITDIKNNTYYAEIMIELNGKTFRIDSRPSDALAIALRTKSPIFITKKILEASIKIPEEDEKDMWSKFGISVQQITPELEEFFGTKGVVVSDVKENSPAYGKIKRGDIIVEVNGKSTKEERGIEVLQDELKRNREIELVVIREGKKLTAKIKTGN